MTRLLGLRFLGDGLAPAASSASRHCKSEAKTLLLQALPCDEWTLGEATGTLGLFWADGRCAGVLSGLILRNSLLRLGF